MIFFQITLIIKVTEKVYAIYSINLKGRFDNMNKKDTIRIINETIADTNYIKDDKIPYYNLEKVLKNWVMVYMGSNIVILIANIIANLLDLQFTVGFFSTIRFLYFSLFLLSLFTYCYQIHKVKMTIKEKDFLFLYLIVPILLSFSKIILPISYYINTDILLNLVNTLSLDLITLLISALLFKNYFKNKTFNYFIIYNFVIYIINFCTIYSFGAVTSMPEWLAFLYNSIIFFKDYGFFVLAHFVILHFCLKVVKNERQYIY